MNIKDNSLRLISIYKITFPNGKAYVGISVNMNNRKRKHLELSLKSEKPLYRAIRKYGELSLLWDILEEVSSWEEAIEKEIFYIDKFNTHILKNGYNLTLGGEGKLGYSPSQETREKIRKSNVGKKRDPEMIKRVSEANRGRVVPPELRERIRKGNLGKKMSEESKIKMRVNRKKTPAKPIDCYGLDNSFIKSYNSITEAVKDLGVNPCSSNIIGDVANKRKYRKTAFGYKWSFKGETL